MAVITGVKFSRGPRGGVRDLGNSAYCKHLQPFLWEPRHKLIFNPVVRQSSRAVSERDRLYARVSAQERAENTLITCSSHFNSLGYPQVIVLLNSQDSNSHEPSAV